MALGPEGAIAQDLSDNGFGTFDPTGANAAADIRVGAEPREPDNVVVVLLLPGGVIPDAVSEEWLVAVRVRDVSYETANERLRSIAIHLQDKEQGLFGGIRIGKLTPASPPTIVSRDESGRWRTEQTFRLLLKRSFTFA